MPRGWLQAEGAAHSEARDRACVVLLEDEWVLNSGSGRRMGSRGHGGPRMGSLFGGRQMLAAVHDANTARKRDVCDTEDLGAVETWQAPRHLGTRGGVAWALGAVRVTWVQGQGLGWPQGLQKPWGWRRLKAVAGQGAVRGSSSPGSPRRTVSPMQRM